MLDPTPINFKKLEYTDMPLMLQWLTTDFVAQWYEEEPTTVEGMRELYGPTIEGTEPNKSFITMYGSTPIGYIQTYKIKDYPEWFATLQPTNEAAGVDIFIGHPDYIHQGLGSFIMRQFLKEQVFSHPEIESCILDVDPANKVAIRTYEKAGFTYWKPIWDKDSQDWQNGMLVTREAFDAQK